jgi:hypothetical protein
LRALSRTIPPEEGGGRADDGVVVEGAGDGGALDDVVLGQVVQCEQAAAFAEFVDQFVGYFAVVEVIRVGGDAFKRAGEFGLTEGLAFFVQMAVALEDAPGVREFCQVGVGKLTGLLC